MYYYWTDLTRCRDCRNVLRDHCAHAMRINLIYNSQDHIHTLASALVLLSVQTINDDASVWLKIAIGLFVSACGMLSGSSCDAARNFRRHSACRSHSFVFGVHGHMCLLRAKCSRLIDGWINLSDDEILNADENATPVNGKFCLFIIFSALFFTHRDVSWW